MHDLFGCAMSACWTAPLRDARGPGIYGKKDLTPEQKKQVAGDSLIAILVAWLALAMADTRYLCDRAAGHEGRLPTHGATPAPALYGSVPS